MLFFKRSTLLATAIRDSRIATYLLAATTNELRRVQEHSLLLSRFAECRMATFLMDLSTRMGNPNYLDLPMSHLDIAYHLGLKIETLSRSITALEKSGSIARASIEHYFCETAHRWNGCQTNLRFNFLRRRPNRCCAAVYVP